MWVSPVSLLPLVLEQPGLGQPVGFSIENIRSITMTYIDLCEVDILRGWIGKRGSSDEPGKGRQKNCRTHSEIELIGLFRKLSDEAVTIVK